jgi:hypothetical protein
LPSPAYAASPEPPPFTSSQLWADVQPEHPPLGLPAPLQVEPESPSVQHDASHLGQTTPEPLAPEFGETGFEFSQLVEEAEILHQREQAAALESAVAATPVDSVTAAPALTPVESEPHPEQPAVSAAASAVPHQTNGTSTALSQAMIEEIVRRVVQEMSDTVIREIAWEIVPDCVERVVEKLSREGLTGK